MMKQEQLVLIRSQIHAIELQMADKYHMDLPDTETLHAISQDATSQLRKFVSAITDTACDCSLTAQFDFDSLHLTLEPNPALASLLKSELTLKPTECGKDRVAAFVRRVGDTYLAEIIRFRGRSYSECMDIITQSVNAKLDRVYGDFVAKGWINEARLAELGVTQDQVRAVLVAAPVEDQPPFLEWTIETLTLFGYLQCETPEHPELLRGDE